LDKIRRFFTKRLVTLGAEVRQFCWYGFRCCKTAQFDFTLVLTQQKRGGGELLHEKLAKRINLFCARADHVLDRQDCISDHGSEFCVIRLGEFSPFGRNVLAFGTF
jgi:hypothetical protein